MLVDDSPIILSVIKDIINTTIKYDIELLPFLDSALAKEQFLSISPDFVITDIDMPKVNGYELIEYIKSVANTPIIAMSGSQFEDNSTNTILHCSKLYGADHKILKSELSEKFSALVTDVIESIQLLKQRN